MNETHRQLIAVGTNILSASRNELYLSMRFLDIALSGLNYEMNLSSLYVGTDGEKILFNPRYLIQRYLSDRVLPCLYSEKIMDGLSLPVSPPLPSERAGGGALASGMRYRGGIHD